jgi:hypothetical protein
MQNTVTSRIFFLQSCLSGLFPMMKSLSIFLLQSSLYLGLAQAAACPRGSTPDSTPSYVMNVEIAGWDQTCDLPNPENHGETRMDAVKRAWEGAMEMAADSWDRWEITKPKLEAIEKSGANPDYVDQLDVDIDDPGYDSFFFSFSLSYV